MRNVIRQSVVLSAPADRLFQMYLDPQTHGAITGAPVIIAEETGSEFRAFDGKLSGQILAGPLALASVLAVLQEMFAP